MLDLPQLCQLFANASRRQCTRRRRPLPRSAALQVPAIRGEVLRPVLAEGGRITSQAVGTSGTTIGTGRRADIGSTMGEQI
jgi:hypothetical protein